MSSPCKKYLSSPHYNYSYAVITIVSHFYFVFVSLIVEIQFLLRLFHPIFIKIYDIQAKSEDDDAHSTMK